MPNGFPSTQGNARMSTTTPGHSHALVARRNCLPDHNPPPSLTHLQDYVLKLCTPGLTAATLCPFLTPCALSVLNPLPWLS